MCLLFALPSFSLRILNRSRERNKLKNVRQNNKRQKERKMMKRAVETGDALLTLIVMNVAVEKAIVVGGVEVDHVTKKDGGVDLGRDVIDGQGRVTGERGHHEIVEKGHGIDERGHVIGETGLRIVEKGLVIVNIVVVLVTIKRERGAVREIESVQNHHSMIRKRMERRREKIIIRMKKRLLLNLYIIIVYMINY